MRQFNPQGVANRATVIEIALILLVENGGDSELIDGKRDDSR